MDLPTARMAGLGFPSHVRLAPIAYEASWKSCGQKVHTFLPRMVSSWDTSTTSTTPSLAAFGDVVYANYVVRTDNAQGTTLSRQEFDSQHPLDLSTCAYPKGLQKALAGESNKHTAERDRDLATRLATGPLRKRAQTRIRSM